MDYRFLYQKFKREVLAWRCGQLYVGDSILTVNKHDLRDTKHADAVRDFIIRCM